MLRAAPITKALAGIALGVALRPEHDELRWRGWLGPRLTVRTWCTSEGAYSRQVVTWAYTWNGAAADDVTSVMN